MNLDGIKKILIIRLSSLGDVLLTTPMLRSLRKQFPQSIIDFCVRDSFKDVLITNPHISNLIEYSKEPARIDEIKEHIAKSDYDLVIDLQNNLRSKVLVSNYKGKVYKFGKYSLEKFLLVNFKINLMRTLDPIPVRYGNTLPGLVMDDEGLEFIIPEGIKSQLPDTKNLIGFSPASRHYTKMWPYEYFIELGEILNLHGYKVVLFGGKDDKAVCDIIAAGIQGSINLCNENNLFQTAANFTSIRTIIANDSGLMHLACALKVPTLAIFGSTVRDFGFGPYKNKARVIENPFITCRPCSHFGRDRCPKMHFNCMMTVTPAMVYQYMLKFLGES
ncbi:MAG: glycosyltransferase family 9 protein [Ignavibacteria bacterium]|nr:glycosyltransferase family 9 protein [Ignavibacteria bacterium]